VFTVTTLYYKIGSAKNVLHCRNISLSWPWCCW